MRANFSLPIEPFSVNSMYYRDRRHKTNDFRDWEVRVIRALSAVEVQKKLQALREHFDEKIHCFVVRLNFAFPATTLFNKQGLVSSRAQDLTNIEKPLIDLLFLPKYHVQAFPAGTPNINADDKHILQLTSKKTKSTTNKHSISVQIGIAKRVAGP